MSSSRTTGSHPPERNESTWSPLARNSVDDLPAAPASPIGNGSQPVDDEQVPVRVVLDHVRCAVGELGAGQA